jgi:hypothetical protein
MPECESDAEAENEMVSDTVEPLDGLVIETDGGELSTVTDIWCEDWLLLVSYATALIVRLPSESVVVSRLVLYGDVLSVAFRTLST